jgi:hypothetical protein
MTFSGATGAPLPPPPHAASEPKAAAAARAVRTRLRLPPVGDVLRKVIIYHSFAST